MKTPGKFADHILLVDDESRILLSFSILLKSNGLRDVVTLEDSRQVIPFLEKNSIAVIILDLIMPFIPGKELLAMIHEKFPEIPVIVMTASNEIETAVECMQAGAVDFLVKPVEKNRFLSSVQRALEMRRLKDELSSLKNTFLSDKIENPDVFADMITASSPLLSIFKYINAVALSSQPVLITGETGVGKELAARALHRARKLKGRFVAVNVAGLDDTMFSDTLFGHKKGAFTGADSTREGLIANAAGGTLFLDEIGDLLPASQVKLLRLIQEREYYSLGLDSPQKTDADIVVATNQDIQKLLAEGKFRKDFYYRLSFHHIHMPPLRERPEDIPILFQYFLEKAAHEMGKEVPIPSPQMLESLANYHFPGNVRELQAMVYDAVSCHQTGSLPGEAFAKTIAAINTQKHAAVKLPTLNIGSKNRLEAIFGKFPTLKQVEDFTLDEALLQAHGNQGLAASFLGITRQALNKRLNRRKKENL